MKETLALVSVGVKRIGMEDPMPTVTANSFIKRPGGAVPIGIAAPVIDKYYATGVTQEADRPLDAVTSKARFGLSVAFLEQANTGMVGHDARDPVSTIVAGGGKDSGWGPTQRLVGADLEPWDEALAATGAYFGHRPSRPGHTNHGARRWGLMLFSSRSPGGSRRSFAPVSQSLLSQL